MSVVRQWDPLVGRRAVYTRITKEWREPKREYVEIKRELFRGIVVALTNNSASGSRVVLLFDDGALGAYDLCDVTIEGESVGYRDGFSDVDAHEYISPKAAGPLPYTQPAPIPLPVRMPIPGDGMPRKP